MFLSTSWCNCCATVANSRARSFTCPECGAGHAWIRRNHAGLAVDCDQGCSEHQVFTALAGLGEREKAA
jgi:predicted RNA-binding Zn-ribbon protein involved in translation (DUF1610 family)